MSTKDSKKKKWDDPKSSEEEESRKDEGEKEELSTFDPPRPKAKSIIEKTRGTIPKSPAGHQWRTIEPEVDRNRGGSR